MGMKVADLMSKSPISVESGSTIRDVVRMIFNLSIGAVLVCKGDKLKGIVTEEDLFHKLLPSMSQFLDAFPQTSTDEIIQKKFSDILDKSVDTIMTKDPDTVTENTSLLRAQSKMLVNFYSHLPVLDNNDRLVGIISQGDIFKAMVGEDVSLDNEGQFYNWLAKHYDQMYEKMKRFEIEADSITKIVKANKGERIIDIGGGSGGHAIELARRGFDVWGLEKSDKMAQAFKNKVAKLPKPIAQHVNLIVVPKRYRDILSEMENTYDAALFLGNALPQIGQDYHHVLEAAIKRLEKKAVVIVQIANFDRVINKKRRLQFFDIFKSKADPGREYALTTFYDEASNKTKELHMNTAVLQNNGKRWATATINSLPVYNLSYTDIKKELQKNGFTNIKLFGSSWGEPLFSKPYSLAESHWINIVAVR